MSYPNAMTDQPQPATSTPAKPHANETRPERYARHTRNAVALIAVLVCLWFAGGVIGGIVYLVHAHSAAVQTQENACNNNGGVWVGGTCE